MENIARRPNCTWYKYVSLAQGSKVMERKIITTSDGSNSLFLPEWNEQYHSKHGAILEAYHVFIKNGLSLFSHVEDVSVLEMGFGTGLNCFISYLEALRMNLSLHYVGIEAYPLDGDLIAQLNYPELLGAKDKVEIYSEFHKSSWGESHQYGKEFSLLKKMVKFEEFEAHEEFDLVYFDAFGARVQPELWTEDIFSRMFKALRSNGVLVTYSAKGSVRRAMQSSGFTVERLPGPPGKREMLRGRKL